MKKQLKIVVLAKQVPDTRNVGKDAMTPEGTVNRAALPAIFNPEDLNALEAALFLKDETEGSTVHILTMGPPRAADIIRAAIFRGADGGYLLTDLKFAGSDTLATSYALSCALRKIQPDVIVAGRQAIDGDTAQVGPEIAEDLGLPQVTYALEAELTDDGLTILKECEDANQKIAVSLPCLVTFTKPSFDPRYPTIKRKLAANRAEIPVLGEDAYPDNDKTRIALKGSPTHVKKSFVQPRIQGGVMIKEESNTASAQKLVAMLSEAHLI